MEDLYLDTPSRQVSRTPSPTGRVLRTTTLSDLRLKLETSVTGYASVASDSTAVSRVTSVSSELCKQDFIRTPRGPAVPTGGAVHQLEVMSGGGSPHAHAGSPALTSAAAPTLPPGVWQCRPNANLWCPVYYMDGFEADASAAVPPPPMPVAPRAAAHGSFQGMKHQMQNLRTSVSSATVVTSVGTVGHPFLCSDACKYAKKPRGCKDGATCARCHVCDWTKHGKKVVS